MMPEAHVGTGAYVLDALPPEERLGFEQHLAGCAACQAEIAGFTETVGRLGASVAEQPPRWLKNQVMTEVSSTRQLPPIARHSRPGPVAEFPPEPEYDESDAPPDERSWTRRNLLALAAGVLAIAGAGGVAYDQLSDARALRRERDRVAALLAASDARTVRGSVKGGGRATVVSSRRRDEAVVVVSGLPTAASGREYQLWFIESKTFARSLGLLGRSPKTSTLLVQGGIAKAAAFGITVEPTGGSPQPSTVPIAALELT